MNVALITKITSMFEYFNTHNCNSEFSTSLRTQLLSELQTHNLTANDQLKLAFKLINFQLDRLYEDLVIRHSNPELLFHSFENYLYNYLRDLQSLTD